MRRTCAKIPILKRSPLSHSFRNPTLKGKKADRKSLGFDLFQNRKKRVRRRESIFNKGEKPTWQKGLFLEDKSLAYLHIWKTKKAELKDYGYLASPING
jgi:hypothetical protein